MSPGEQFVAAFSNAGPIATGLALLAIPAAWIASARHTKTGLQAKIDGLEADVRRLTDKVDDLRAAKEAELDAVRAAAHAERERAAEQYRELESRYDAVLRTRAALQSQLDVITSTVADIATRVNARDYSVLVPAPTLVPGDRPNELVFLCASGKQGKELRALRVPIESSMAGSVFLSGQSRIASPAPTAFSQATDKLLDYRTDETLTVCLDWRGEPRGVVQFLNRRSGRFDGSDVHEAEQFRAQLATLVGEFTADPSRLGELGYSPRRNDFEATVLFVDLSGYSQLFDLLDNSVVNDMLNQYFEALGSVAFAHNAVIDQFIGDGMLIIFGDSVHSRDHGKDAIRAAREMRDTFQGLRDRWRTIQYRGAENLFVRFGLASGPLTRTEIGHRQFRRVTVLGACVNHAAHVCERAPRGRDTICLSRRLRDATATPTQTVSDDDCGIFEVTS
jgi:class 3 adenylate cyclase/outer membrane murein-binding lipoprotein Lpp